MLASGRSLGFNAGWPGGFTQGSERGLQLSFGCQVISHLLSLRDSLLRHKENPGRFFIVTLAHYRSHHDGNFSSFGLTHLHHCMFWAACNLAYFSFLRSAEFTIPNLVSYVLAIHLRVADIAVDSHSSPLCLRLRIKASKTDPFRKGCFLYVGRGVFPLCAISSMLAYLNLRGDASGLFLFRDGRPLSRALLTSWLRGILSAAGNFSSHSFRIGAATVAARNGIPDHQIQALGRWSRSAYLLYIRTPAESLSRLSKQLSLSTAH